MVSVATRLKTTLTVLQPTPEVVDNAIVPHYFIDVVMSSDFLTIPPAEWSVYLFHDGSIIILYDVIGDVVAISNYLELKEFVVKNIKTLNLTEFSNILSSMVYLFLTETNNISPLNDSERRSVIKHICSKYREFKGES